MADRKKVLSKGDKFTAKGIDEGEFTYHSNIKEFSDSDCGMVLAFKDGTPWLLDETDIDNESIPVIVFAGPSTVAFSKRPKGE